MNILDPSLRTALKTLKLTGKVDTLDARLAQICDGTLGRLEYLQVLCEDEIGRRESTALTRRIRSAKFEEQSNFEGFDFAANNKLPTAMLRDLSALRWLAAAESVILYGPVGVGKTHVAQALGHAVARRGVDVRFAKTSASSPTWREVTPTAPGEKESATTPSSCNRQSSPLCSGVICAATAVRLIWKSLGPSP